MTIGNVDEATAYLDGLINRERSVDYAYRRLDLRPIEALLEALGRPDRSLSIIHVAGSKGKGSTCLFAESILRALGESTGAFTSPHLEHWTERFRIDGQPITDATLVAAVQRLQPAVERLREGPVETRPSFFDATTAIALLVFAEARVDRVLLEVGLGGRLDSTNAVTPAVTCVTSIELEHTDKLGETEAEIAGEKAGILKPGVPAVVGPLREAARSVVHARAAEVAAPVRQAGRDFSWAPAPAAAQGEHAAWRFESEATGDLFFALPVPGAAAGTNAALAIACVQALGAWDEASVARAAARGLGTCRLPGRTERLDRDPRVLVDAAHTQRSSEALAEVLETLAPDGYDLVLSVSADKALAAFLAPLLRSGRVGRIVTTRAEPTRSLPARELAEIVAAALADISSDSAFMPEVAAIDAPEAALREARASLAPGHLLVATGSVYLAGIARRVLGAEPAA